MSKSTVLRILPILCAVFLLNACQKESDTPLSIENNAGPRFSGAVSDDPARVAKVPVIMSAAFSRTLKDLRYNTVPDVLATRSGKPQRDVTAPTVTITSPANGATVSGTIVVQVSASDNVGVTSVSLSANGIVVGTLTAPPYNFNWTVSSGTTTLTATANDAAGNTASHSITVSQNTVVADTIRPSVSITSPANGATVSGRVNVSVSASDNIGVTSVRLSVDGSPVSTLTAPPYNFVWDASTASDGPHTLTATANDAAGNTGTSSISVAKSTNIDTLPPAPVPPSFSLAMPAVRGQGTEGSCTAFAVGYYSRSAGQYYKTGATAYSLSANVFSPEFLYNQIKMGDACSSGSSILDAMDFLQYVGICTWQSMPYSSDNGCSLMPTPAQNAEAAQFKIASYAAVYTSDLAAMKNLLNNKKPLVIMFGTDDSFSNAGPGFIWRSYSSPARVSHVVSICGYDDAKHAVKIVNSWGTAWGDGGYSWIDYDFLPVLTANAYVMNL